MSIYPLSFRDARPDAKATEAQLHLQRTPISLLLDRITDDKNIGMIFRMADGARLSHVYLHGKYDYQMNKKVRRISRNTTCLTPWSTLPTLKEVNELAQQQPFIGLEWTNTSIDYRDYSLKQPIVLVLGNEVEGIHPDLLALCTQSIHLPMLGLKTSLNVAMAAGIAVYGLLPR